MNKLFVGFVVVLLIGVVGVYIFKQDTPENEPPVEEETPTEEMQPPATTLERSPLIEPTLPVDNQTVTSPLTLTGTARGYWFFEASAPVTVTNVNGMVLGQSYITATESWMTEDFVPYSGTISYTLPVGTTELAGFIVLERDNPSGLPENAARYELPVVLH
ncbi:MAG: Gmad2 immunoglobulin-like domain-containing protein [Candidatus Paceibacterota bacterium]